jgi:isoquinoline 1-oxidoreductase alpha subunit
MNVTVDGKKLELLAPKDTPLLWVLREEWRNTSVKFGCGMGLCGACTVHVNGQAVRSCQTEAGSVVGKKVTTLRGLHPDADHPVQKAWRELNVVQCGYCQPGQMMSAAALLAKNKNPTDQEIVDAMNGNLCRCGTYPRIRAAVRRAAEIMRTGGGRDVVR